MALIGSVNNQGSIQGQINEANGYLTGVISDAGLLGGQVVGMRGLKGDKGDKGDTGATGATGVGIASIAKTSSAGKVDTYTITYTNGNTATFTVTNGNDGTDGQDGHSPVVTATKSGSKTYISVDGVQIAEIDDGATGATGNGIASITKTGSAGTDPVVDTYTVTYTNGNSDTFTVTNGVKGDTGATPVITATKSGKVTTIKADGVDIATINDGDDGHSPVITASKTGTTTHVYVDGVEIAQIEDGTDTKVTQTASTPSSYTYWRPIVVGYASGSSEGFTPTTQTNTTYAFNTLECQPSSGTIRCGVLDLYKGSYTVKASPDTLTANRTLTLQDKSGTVALTSDIPTVPANLSDLTNDMDVSDFPNDAGYLTSAHEVPSGGSSGQVLAKHSGTDYDLEWVNQSGGGGTVTDVEVNGTSVVTGGVAEVTVPTKTSDLTNDALFAKGHIGNFHGTCASSASATEKVVTCADFKSTDLVAGAIIVVSFTNTNSGAVASLTMNVNSTGAYGIKRNNSGTIGNLDSAGYIKASTSYMFYFDGTYWVIAGYDTNTNTIGYTIRTNGLQMKMKTACYRYRICFTSADGEYLVPANSSTSTSATASKTVTTEKIDPWGRIIYYNTTAAVSANSYPTASYLVQQYNGVTLGYSFNRTGSALTMTTYKPVYVKATPQSDGSAIIDGTTPFVQALPSTEDGKIYIFIGIATSATAIEFTLEHPVYYYKDGQIRLWTNQTSNGNGVFLAEKGVATYSDVYDAYDAGQTIYAFIDEMGDITYAPLIFYTESSGDNDGSFIFSYSNNSFVGQWVLAEDDTWTESYSTIVNDVKVNGSSVVDWEWDSDENIYLQVADITTSSTPTASTISEFDSNAKMNSTDMSSAEVTSFVNSLGYSYNLIDIFYPVGSYYETSDTSFNPNISWGGTWALETEGQVHVSGSASGTYQVSGALTDTTDGGEATHTLLTTEIPAHSHIRNANGGYNDNFSTGSGRTIPTNNSTGTKNNLRTADEGGGQAHNNMQPYIIVYRWHRTA